MDTNDNRHKLHHRRHCLSDARRYVLGAQRAITVQSHVRHGRVEQVDAEVAPAHLRPGRVRHTVIRACKWISERLKRNTPARSFVSCGSDSASIMAASRVYASTAIESSATCTDWMPSPDCQMSMMRLHFADRSVVCNNVALFHLHQALTCAPFTMCIASRRCWCGRDLVALPT